MAPTVNQMHWIEIEYQGRTRRVAALRSNGRLWFHLDGVTHALDQRVASGRRAARGAPSDSSILLSPMPGKIKEINVYLGKSVKQGDVVVVLEAMKMEYTLKANQDGVVAELGTTLGAQVTAGQVLVRLADAT